MTTEPVSESYDEFVEETVSTATNQFYAEVRKEMCKILTKNKFNIDIETLGLFKRNIRFHCNKTILWKVHNAMSSFLEKGGKIDGPRKTVQTDLLAKIASEIGPNYNREFALETERMMMIIAGMENEMKATIMNIRNEVFRQMNGLGAEEMGNAGAEADQVKDVTEAMERVVDQVSQEEQYKSPQKQKETIEILEILMHLKIEKLLDDALQGLVKLPGIIKNDASFAIIKKRFALTFKADFGSLINIINQQESGAIELVEDMFNGHRFLLPEEPGPGDLVIPTGGFEMCRCAPGCPFESRQIAYRRVDKNFR